MRERLQRCKETCQSCTQCFSVALEVSSCISDAVLIVKATLLQNTPLPLLSEVSRMLRGTPKSWMTCSRPILLPSVALPTQASKPVGTSDIMQGRSLHLLKIGLGNRGLNRS